MREREGRDRKEDIGGRYERGLKGWERVREGDKNRVLMEKTGIGRGQGGNGKGREVVRKER